MRAFLVVIAVSAAMLQQCRGRHKPVEEAAMANFQDAVGINVHLQYQDTPYAHLRQVQEALAFLGLRHVRDSAFRRGTTAYDHYVALAQSGIHFDLIYNSALDEQLRRTAELEIAAPGAVEMVEGPNEINNDLVAWAGRHGAAAAEALQAALYAHVHSMRANHRPVVLSYTNWPPSNGRADAINVHSYAKGGVSPMKQMGWDVALVQATEPPVRPFYISETGISNSQRSNDNQQAAILITELLDGFRLGSVRTYIYELFDERPDLVGFFPDPENHYGLFDVNGRPKVAACALRTLLSLGRVDDGKVRPVSAKALRIIGGSGSISTLALTKADGSWILIVWREPGSRTYDQPATLQFSTKISIRAVDLLSDQIAATIAESKISMSQLGSPRVFLVRAV